MKLDFITIGGATEDIAFYTQEAIIIDNKKDVLRQKLMAFEYGAKVKIDNVYSTFGGGAANAAVCLSKLGLDSAALVAIGKDARGESILRNFKSNKVETKLVETVPSVETGFSFVLIGSGNEHVVFSNRGANSHLKIKKAHIPFLKKAKRIYLTSLSGDWENNILKPLFTIGNTKIMWNPGHRQIICGVKNIGKYLAKTEILSVNKDEAIELAISGSKRQKNSVKELNSEKFLLKALKSFGPNLIVITCGKDGAYAYDGKTFYYQKILKEKRLVDTTGVGDAFGSTFTAGMEIFKGNIQKSLYLGVKNTASVISLQGAQNGLLTRKELL